MLRQMLIFLALPLVLTGCSALGTLTGGGDPLDAYEISTSDDAPLATRTQGVDVIVEVPSASAALDTESILIRPQPTQLQYLPDARWIEPVPQMVQSALVDGLDRSGAFRYVGRRPLGTSGDYALVTTLGEFNAELVPGGEGAVVSVRITARLVREDDLAIVASDVFAATIGVPNTETPTLIAGFDAAGSEVLDQIVDWTLAARGVGTRPR